MSPKNSYSLEPHNMIRIFAKLCTSQCNFIFGCLVAKHRLKNHWIVLWVFWHLWSLALELKNPPHSALPFARGVHRQTGRPGGSASAACMATKVGPPGVLLLAPSTNEARKERRMNLKLKKWPAFSGKNYEKQTWGWVTAKIPIGVGSLDDHVWICRPFQTNTSWNVLVGPRRLV